MQLRKSLSLIVPLLLFSGCEVRQDKPIAYSVLDLRSDHEFLTCVVNNQAKKEGLTFHHSESEQDFGVQSAFRLVGDEFEVIMVNDAKAHEYHLTAYDLSGDGSARRPALKAFEAIQKVLRDKSFDACG